MKKMSILATFAVILVALSVGLSWQFHKSSEGSGQEMIGSPSEPSEQEVGTPAISDMEIRNPEIAQKYGICGYVEITADSPRSVTVRRGGELKTTILLRFVSYRPELREVELLLNPQGRSGLTVLKYYSVEDEKGNIVEERCIVVNQLVKYDVTAVTVKANQTVPIIMTLRIPEDLPPGEWFPLGAVGIPPIPYIPMIDNVNIKVIISE